MEGVSTQKMCALNSNKDDSESDVSRCQTSPSTRSSSPRNRTNRSSDEEDNNATGAQGSGKEDFVKTNSYMSPIETDIDEETNIRERDGVKQRKRRTRRSGRDHKTVAERGHAGNIIRGHNSRSPSESESEQEMVFSEASRKKCLKRHVKRAKGQGLADVAKQQYDKQHNDKNISKEYVVENEENPGEGAKKRKLRTPRKVQQGRSTRKKVSKSEWKAETENKRSGNNSERSSDMENNTPSAADRLVEDAQNDRDSDFAVFSDLEDDEQQIKKAKKQKKKVSHGSKISKLDLEESTKKATRKVEKGQKKLPLKCNLCGRAVPSESILKRHMLTHTGEKPFPCPDCGRRYTSSSNLRIHRLSHSGKMDYVCNECNQKFTHLPYLKRHLLRHTGKKMYMCDQCGKDFFQKFHLERHLLLHTGGMPYACDRCSMTFNRSDNLNSHIRTAHPGEDKKVESKPKREKTHICGTCGKAFYCRANLEAHERVHSGVTPFACNICYRRFKQGSQMMSHMRTHSGEKPHACDICNKRFSRKYYMRKHKERLHPA